MEPGAATENQPPDVPKRNVVLHWISQHPFGVVVAFLGALASIGGIPLAIILWQAVPKRELTYSIQPIRTAIVQGSRSDLSVTYKGHKISGDLTAAQISIENVGKEPIRMEDIIIPIALVISNGNLIEASISKPTSPGTDFQLGTNIERTYIQDLTGGIPLYEVPFRNHSNQLRTVTDPVRSNDLYLRMISEKQSLENFKQEAESQPATRSRIAVNWRILEKGDKAVVQLVYAGNVNAPIMLTGRIVGQSAPREKPWPSEDNHERIKGFLVFALGAPGFFLLSSIAFRGQGRRQSSGFRLLMFWASFAIWLLIASFVAQFVLRTFIYRT